MMNLKGKTLFELFFIFTFAVGLYFSTEWEFKARLFPQMIVISGLVISIYDFLISNFWQNTIERKGQKAIRPEAEAVHVQKKSATPKSEWTMILWVLLFFGMIILLGFWITIILYTVLFMSIFGRENWKVITTYSVGIWITIYLGLSLISSSSLYGGILGLTW